jgi:hypothetical protein
MIRALARYCEYRGVYEVEEERLRDTLAPATLLTPRSGETTAGATGTVWKDSIDLAVELGIAAREDGVVRFQEALIADLAAADVSSFRRSLRRVVLAHEHNDGLWDQTADSTWSAQGAREFSRIAAWVLDSAPGELTFDGAYEASRRAIEGSAKLIENVEQWRVFVRWAEAIGLSSRVADYQLCDPALAVEEEIGDVFAGGDSVLPARSVRDRLVTVLPVLRDGTYTRGLDRFLAKRPRRLPNEAGHALAFALRRLAARGVITFDRQSDADQLILDDPQSDRNPTHIALSGFGR